jgi:DNA-binding CsgD family transcriptional regulator
MTSNKSVESKNSALSGRELEVVYYFLQDKTAAEMGDAMNISKKTIDWHLAEIRKKLKCSSSKNLKAKLLSDHFDWDEITG